MTTPTASSRAPGVLAFTLAGFPVAVHPTFWFVTLALGFTGTLSRALVWVVAVFASVLVHELGHAFMARAFGCIARIDLHAMGGTTTPRATRPLSTRASIAISLAGPFAGIAFGALVIAVSLFAHPASALARVLIADLLWTNLGYGLLNFLPILPLDGGLVMASLVSRVRGRPSPALTAGISVFFAALLAVTAAVLHVTWGWFMLAWLAFGNARPLRDAWRVRRTASLAPALDAMTAALSAGDFAGALARADALRSRVHTPDALARVLSVTAAVQLHRGDASAARATLDAFPAGWWPDPVQDVNVSLALGETDRAMASLHERMARAPSPALTGLMATTLVHIGNFSEAKRVVLDATADAGRDAVFAVEAALFGARRFEESLVVAARAFEAFAQPDDAYNAACALTHLGRLDDAMDWLRRALAAGYRDAAHLDGDQDLAPLRAHRDYAALRASLG